MLGEPPEVRVSQPRMGGQQEEGPFEEGKLVLTIQPTRVDWLFAVAEDKEPNVGEITAIGAFPELLDKFLTQMLHWFELETCPSAQRLAFGAVLLQPVESRQEGYRQLSAYLPCVQLDPAGSSDFFYQINRPKNSSSGMAGLRINRLSKWSVAVTRGSVLSFGQVSTLHTLGSEHFACRLELDINTAPGFSGELTQEELPVIFQELVDLGKEIAQEGDIS